MKETRFKDTEIGRIPEEWEVKRLGDVCKTSSGGTPSRSIPSYYVGDIPWVTTGELKDGYIFDTIEHITDAAIVNSSAKIFPNGTLLMAMYGATIGRLGIIQKPSATNQACCAILPEDDELKYIFYQLLFDRPNIINRGCGAGQPNISQDIVKSLCYPFPKSRAEQSHIASALTSIDNLISSLDKLIEKKKNIKQATMQQILTGHKRLKGFNEPWVEQKLLDSFSIIGNNTYSRDELSDSGTVRDVHYGDVLIKYGSVINAASAELPFIKGKETVSHPLMDGDIIMADTAEDETCGKVCEIRGIEDSLIEAGLHTIVLRPNCPYGPCFLGYYMNSSVFHDLLLPLMQGTKVTSISKTTLMNVQMVIPSSITEQSEIAKVLVSMDNDITALESKKAKYKSIKQGMMQQLLTGKIRFISTGCQR